MCRHQRPQPVSNLLLHQRPGPGVAAKAVVAVHSCDPVCAHRRRRGVPGRGRVLCHRGRQGLGGLHFDVHQEVPEVPEAGVCVSQVCFYTLPGLWVEERFDRQSNTHIKDNRQPTVHSPQQETDTQALCEGRHCAGSEGARRRREVANRCGFDAYVDSLTAGLTDWRAD